MPYNKSHKTIEQPDLLYHMEVSQLMEVPQARWMVYFIYFIENPPKKWMIWGTPNLCISESS